MVTKNEGSESVSIRAFITFDEELLGERKQVRRAIGDCDCTPVHQVAGYRGVVYEVEPRTDKLGYFNAVREHPASSGAISPKAWVNRPKATESTSATPRAGSTAATQATSKPSFSIAELRRIANPVIRSGSTIQAACPTCGQPQEKRCRSKSGKLLPQNHALRIKAALAS
jgi:hypothetical protein